MFEHLPDGGVFQPQHMVDENTAVIIRSREAVRFRRQLVVILERLCQAERIKVGMKMPTHAIGADHHDGANRIARRPQNVGIGDRARHNGRVLLYLLFEVLLDGTPVAIERRHQFPIGRDRPVRPGPGCALGILFDIVGVVLKRAEKILPLHADRRRISLIAGIEVLDVVGVSAIEERSQRELVVGLILS